MLSPIMEEPAQEAHLGECLVRGISRRADPGYVETAINSMEVKHDARNVVRCGKQVSLRRLGRRAQEKWRKKCFKRRQEARRSKEESGMASPSQDVVNDWVPLPWNMLKWKKELTVGTWNVRTLLGDAQQELVCRTACREKVGLLAVQEPRWEREVEGLEIGGYLWYGGGAWKNGIGARTGGVMVAVHKALGGAVLAKVHKKGRVQLVKLKGMFGRNLVFGSLYVPTESEEGGEEKRNAFWEMVQEALAEVEYKERDVLLLGIDNNGETGKSEEEGEDRWVSKECMGKWRVGKSNENGKRLVEECEVNGWSIASTFFSKAEKKKWTFYGKFQDGDGRFRREYDHIVCDEKTRKRVVKMKNVRNTLHESDHCLRIAKVQLKGKEFRPKEKEKSMTAVMRTKEAAEMVEKEVSEKLQHIIEDDAELESEVDVEGMWKELKEVIFKAVEGRKELSWPPNSRISEETMKLIKQRAQLRVQLEAKGDISEELKMELREMRKKVRQAIEKDKVKFFEDVAEEAEIASRVGNIKGVFSALKKVTGMRGGAADLRNSKVDDFVQHFQNLVGVSETKISPECKEKRAWEIAEEWLADSARHEAAWDIDTGPPSWEEMKKAATMGKPGKAVNRAEIPSELWRNSESSLKVLWKLMRVMWVRMSEEMGDDQMPEDWVDATLVCLYKGKGSRQDPGMYRGISLISSMEKIFTTVILNRIKEWVDKVISQQACGFRADKSCRDAVFSLWRRMERKWRAKEGFIITFIDFSKAFDSLVWDTLW